MGRGGARIGRLALAAALAYLTIGIVWETAFSLALIPSGHADTDISPWKDPISFVVWFLLPSGLWPSSVSEFLPGGAAIAVGLFLVMTAIMFGALGVIAPGARGAPPPSRSRSPQRAGAGRPRTS